MYVCPAPMSTCELTKVPQADIWTLPGKQRLHAAIGKEGQMSSASDGRDVRNAIGVV